MRTWECLGFKRKRVQHRRCPIHSQIGVSIMWKYIYKDAPRYISVSVCVFSCRVSWHWVSLKVRSKCLRRGSAVLCCVSALFQSSSVRVDQFPTTTEAEQQQKPPPTSNKQTNSKAKRQFTFISIHCSQFVCDYRQFCFRSTRFHHARTVVDSGQWTVATTYHRRVGGRSCEVVGVRTRSFPQKVSTGTPTYDAPCDALSVHTQQQTQRLDQNPYKMAISASAREFPRA